MTEGGFLYVSDLPGSIRRGLWREWAIGRLRREHSKPWWSYMQGIEKKMDIENWKVAIAHGKEMMERGERPNAPPPPHPLDDPGIETGRFRQKPRFPPNIEVRA